MNEKQFEAIEDAVAIIDKDIKQVLDLDSISREVGISKYHLHRLFKSITGKTLMAYVRRRRLSSSLNELINSNLNIIDISNEYHFEHEQSYIRAFKQMFDITPAQYRRLKYELPIEQKIDTYHMRSIGQGLMIEPRMCIRPAFYIQGITDEIVHDKNLVDRDTNKLVEMFQNIYFPQIENKANDHIYIGYVMYTQNPQYSNHYISSIEVTKMNTVEPPFVVREIPTHEYAVFRYVGLHSPYEVTYATLMDLYDYIEKWKADSDYIQADAFHFERMDLETCSENYCEMDIYVPIMIQKYG